MFKSIQKSVPVVRNLIRQRTKTTSSIQTTTTSNNTGLYFVAGGWTAFLLENIVLSENREWLCEKYGEENYHLGYNTLSSTACLSILYGYMKHKNSGKIWSKFTKGAAPLPLRITSIVLQSFGLACFVQLVPAIQIPLALETGSNASNAFTKTNDSNTDNKTNDTNVLQATSSSVLNPQVGPSRQHVPTTETPPSTAKYSLKARCPMDFRAKPELGPDEVYGVERISRHTNLWALASMGVGTALITPFMVESMFFAGPLLLATFGTAHQDARFRRGMGGMLSKEKEEKTSNVPFAAFLVGKQDWSKLFDEVKWLNGGLATLLVVAAHVR